MSPHNGPRDWVLSSSEERVARRWYRNRFNVALVGLVGVVWWIPAWVFLPHHGDVIVFGLTGILGAMLLAVGLWKAHLVARDFHEGNLSEGTFEFVHAVKVYGQTLYRWRSPNRHLDCQKAMVPDKLSPGDQAAIRYLSRSGLPLSVTPLGSQFTPR